VRTSSARSQRFPIIEFDREDARQAGHIRAFLSARGQDIGPDDVLIVGQGWRAT
jgi:tRNA(fMet)-specific endonuclease VapC